MKLIIEKVDDVQFIVEAKDGSPKRMFIEGVFLQSAVKNRNGRIYPEHVMDSTVRKYITEKVNTQRAVGELNHPASPSINLDRVSHRIVSLVKEGKDYVGRAQLTNTPMGKIAQGLIEDGVNLGVSSRGMGSLVEKDGVMEVQEDFYLATAADIVSDPSAPDAYVAGVMEGAEWWYDVASGSWHREHIDESRRAMKKMSLTEISEQKTSIFEAFLNSLKS